VKQSEIREEEKDQGGREEEFLRVCVQGTSGKRTSSSRWACVWLRASIESNAIKKKLHVKSRVRKTEKGEKRVRGEDESRGVKGEG
jgi:hypothetical protein